MFLHYCPSQSCLVFFSQLSHMLTSPQTYLISSLPFTPVAPETPLPHIAHQSLLKHPPTFIINLCFFFNFHFHVSCSQNTPQSMSFTYLSSPRHHQHHPAHQLLPAQSSNNPNNSFPANTTWFYSNSVITPEHHSPQIPN